MDIIQINNNGPSASAKDYTFGITLENTITKTITIQKIPLGLSKGLESSVITTIQQPNNNIVQVGVNYESF